MNCQGVTLLWALRSPCNMSCEYCYFGTMEEHRKRSLPPPPGELSHIGKNDVSWDEMIRFAKSCEINTVRRVFVVGGEPLVWDEIRQVVASLKKEGVEVIVSTNGLPLRDKRTVSWLLHLGVDAISISLDSYDSTYNDHWRIDPSGAGWKGVVNGIQMLVKSRNECNGQMRIGIYSVITRHNITHILDTFRFVANLGMDYFIVQPVSLRPDHKLYRELSLTPEHSSLLGEAMESLRTVGVEIYLPDHSYQRLVLLSISQSAMPIIRNCFGGRDLFFIEPDGSVWDCPSVYKIAETPLSGYASIVGESARELFSMSRRSKNTDCSFFSRDCVNMWQLMAFDDILHGVMNK